MTISVQVALWAVGTLLAIGAFYADTRRRLTHLEKLMNGDTPFVRRSELSIMKDADDEEHERIWHRLDRLEEFKRSHGRG